MRRRHHMLVPALAALLLSLPALAQDKPPPVPPENAVKLSDIIAKVEARDQFRYISEISWDEDGYYTITYFTADKAKVEMNFNPVTGQPQ